MHRCRALLIPVLLLALPAGALAAPATKVRMKEERPGLLARARVEPQAAAATARAKLPNAREVSAEIEEENGRLIYTFDFKTKGKSGIDEVNVDATTGEVTAVEHESPSAEAKEKAAEAKKMPVKPR
jgi:hypothetical protein